MKMFHGFAALGALALASAALAEGTPDIRTGKTIVTSDGMRIGAIDSVRKDKGGAAQFASVIYDSRFLYIPVGTLSAGEKNRLVTSLTKADITKMK